MLSEPPAKFNMPTNSWPLCSYMWILSKRSGVKLTQEEENEIYDEVDFQANQNFSDRIRLVSIWGLRLDSRQSSCDPIKPGYEQFDKDSADYPKDWDTDSTIPY